MKPAKPLWGFGWAGWCLLPVAIALAWVWWSGYDLRYWLLWTINETLGPRAMMLLLGNWLIWQWNAMTVPQFGPFALLYLLLAMHIHPHRFSWRLYASLVLWILIRPCLPSWSFQIGRPLGPWWHGTFGVGGNQMGWGLSLAETAFALADLLILWFLTRSRLVVAAALLGGSVYLLVLWQTAITGSFSVEWAGWFPVRYFWSYGWALCVGCASMWWAISARRAVRKPHECRSCGYDMRGSPPDRCPECGAASPATVPAAAAATSSVHLV